MKITTPQVVDQLRSEYERLHDLPPDLDPEVREAYYRDHIVANPARQRAQGGDGRVVCRLVLAHG